MANFVETIEGEARRHVDLLETLSSNELKIPQSYIDFVNA